MKYPIFILLYLTLVSVNSVHSLAGGTNVVLGDYPAHVAVVVSNAPFGGTIINQNHVLTACGAILNAQRELVALNVITLRPGSIAFTGGLEMTVVAAFPHPEYNPWTFNHDVAVLRTTNNFDFSLDARPNIAPAILNERVIGDATNCFVVGFNPTAALPNPPLQQLQQTIVNRDNPCNSATMHNGRALESMICASPPAANQGICPATRGGGIYCNGILTGVASSGLGCGSAPPALYAQVRDHLAWINAQLTRTQIPQPGPTPAPGVPAGASSVIVSTLLLSIAFLLTKL